MSGKLKVFHDRCSEQSIEGITGGVDGALWYSGQGYIGRITPRGKIKRWALKGFPIQSAVPLDITAGPGHAAWFTTFRTIGRIAPRAAKTSSTVVPPGRPHACDVPISR